MIDTMSLLKYEQKTPKLIPYEQLYIQTYYKKWTPYSWPTNKWRQPTVQLIIDTLPTNI